MTAQHRHFHDHTATGTYFQIGKIVFLSIHGYTQTAIGTATSDLIVTVPVTPVARDQNVSGNTRQCNPVRSRLPTESSETMNDVNLPGGNHWLVFYEAA